MGAVTLHPSGTETTSGIGDTFSIGAQHFVGLFVNVSEVSGVLPTLVVQLQQSPNGNDWYNVSGAVTGSLVGIALTPILPSSPELITDTIRIIWTIGGVNPSFTFEVELEAV